eukprot:NODE_4043_length_847_cov_200.784461_g3351_i0.p1 GENE.NODE_4043_length_847_cov_200.784461_g3351_i0~~NODE_4043_length_847_cov_200.784461_g3351_i0.p1  ORF type:complete len:201 (-),score=26.96 NODE_4043_length_847_cov_200.784461_g3351_i0:81-683(-)
MSSGRCSASLITACRAGDNAEVRRILRKKGDIDINAQGLTKRGKGIIKKISDGKTMYEIVPVGPRNKKDVTGSPLHFAVAAGKKETVRLLLSFDLPIDFSLPAACGATALQMTEDMNRPNTAEIIRARAHPESLVPDLVTPCVSPAAVSKLETSRRSSGDSGSSGPPRRNADWNSVDVVDVEDFAGSSEASTESLGAESR